MTNRLHSLEREREQLEQALADDPHWQAFCDAQRRAASAGPVPQLSPEVLAGLTRSQPFAAYMEVVREIDRIKAATPPPQPAAESQPAPSPVPEASPPPPQQIDDLTAIRRINRDLEKQLNALGIYAYETIATWDRHQVRAVRDALQLQKRIWRENWIEQAALLHQRQADRPSAQPAPLPVVAAAPTPAEPAPTQDIAAAVAIAAPTPSEEPPPEPPEADPATTEPSDPAPPQDTSPGAPTFRVGRRPPRLPAPAARRFAYLRGVSDELSEELRAAGIKSIAEIAEWTRSDVRWFQAMLGEDAQISGDQWIEQAALLARGHWTRHALRVVSGETRLLVPRPEPIVAPASAQDLPEPEDHPSDDTPATDQAADLTTDPAPLPEGPETAVPESAIPDIEESAHDNAHAHSDTTAPTAAETPPPLTIVEATEPPAPPIAEQPDEQPAPPPVPAVPVAAPPARKLIGKINRPPPDLGSHDQAEQPPPPAPAPAPSSPQPPEPPEPPPVHAPAPISAFSALQRPPPPSTEAKVQPPAVDNRPSVPLAIDRAVPDVGDQDDRADAEALIIKRPEPTSVETKLKDDTPLAPEPATPAAPEPQEDDLPDAPIWGDEADVVIVTREGARPEPERPKQQPPAARAEQAASAPVPQHRPSMRPFDEDPQYEASASYGNAVEEASVTIIRAESSQEDAASVVPNDIANDADAPQPAEQKSSTRTIGSRFLKALTGK